MTKEADLHNLHLQDFAVVRQEGVSKTSLGSVTQMPSALGADVSHLSS